MRQSWKTEVTFSKQLVPLKLLRHAFRHSSFLFCASDRNSKLQAWHRSRAQKASGEIRNWKDWNLFTWEMKDIWVTKRVIFISSTIVKRFRNEDQIFFSPCPITKSLPGCTVSISDCCENSRLLNCSMLSVGIQGHQKMSEGILKHRRHVAKYVFKLKKNYGGKGAILSYCSVFLLCK